MPFSADFSNAQLPALVPLKNSFAVDDTEDQLRNLFIELFDSKLAATVFDANVLGMAHLGSMDIVRQMITKDGLVLLPGERNEPSARYVYRAWKSTNTQGRGLHFLKTYLQALYPGTWEVQQQLQDISTIYPEALYDRDLYEASTDKYLTSRVHIRLDTNKDISGLQSIISTILPARFVPKIFITSIDNRLDMVIFANGIGSIGLIAYGAVSSPDISFPTDSLVVSATGNICIGLIAYGAV